MLVVIGTDCINLILSQIQLQIQIFLNWFNNKQPFQQDEQYSIVLTFHYCTTVLKLIRLKEFCACPKPWSRFLTNKHHYAVVIFMLNDLMWEVTHVCFIDIGVIVDHHCLNFLFIIHSYYALCHKIQNHTMM
jgi:hypothetical protein